MYNIVDMKLIRLCVFGDKDVGKTSLFASFKKSQKLSDSSRMSVVGMCDQISVRVNIDNTWYKMYYYEINSSKNNKLLVERIAPMFYEQVDLFLICYLMVDPASYSHIPTYYNNILTHSPHANIVFVGTKRDLVDQPQIVGELRERGECPLTFGVCGIVCGCVCRGVCAESKVVSSESGMGVSGLFEDVILKCHSKMKENQICHFVVKSSNFEFS